ncbi:MAG: hypothetical protein LV471_11070 [Nitrosomonas sp.]|nr:hypothetical protein [Nitrosomonas sp.]
MTIALTMVGMKGPKGDSAYQVAVANGFQGTEQRWRDLFENRGGVVDREYTCSRTAVSAGAPHPIDFFNNTLYGYYNNDLYKSTDEGVSWSIVSLLGATGGDVKRIFPCGAEVLVLRKTTLIRSVGWPAPSSWETKLTLEEGEFVEWGLDGDGTKFIVADYGVPHTTSNYLWISVNGGVDWAQYEKNVLHPGDDAGTHFHGVAYDSIEDRFWHCMGDNAYRGHYYSNDDGATWNEVPLGAGMLGSAAQAVSISTTPHGMVLASDSGVNGGMYRILRRDNPADMRTEMIWRWPNELTSVRGFAFKNSYDPISGITFICWRTDVSNNPPMITWTDGLRGGIFYEWHDAWSATDGIRNIVVLPSGKILASIYRIGFAPEVLTFKKFRFAAPHQDSSGLLIGGKITGATNDSLAAGQGTKAVSGAMAIGHNCNSTSFGGVAIGVSAVAGANDTAVGYNAVVAGTNGVAIGRDALAGGNEAVVIGSGSTSSFDRSVLIGRQIIDAGAQNVLIGHDVDVTNNGQWNVVIGAFADADSSNNVVVGRIANSSGTRGTALGAFARTITKGVAIGYNAICDTTDSVAIGDSTNTELPNAVAIGPRDLHVQATTKGVVLTSPNGTKYRITVDDAGVLVTSAI